MSFNRRSILKLSAVGLAAPMILNASNALTSSRNVKVLAWGDCIQPNIVEAFKNESGIKLKITTFGSNDEAERTIRANGEQVLLPSSGEQKALPTTKEKMPVDGQVSYGDLWTNPAKGQAAFRQESVIKDAGLYLDAIGEVPSNRMLDSYKSEEDARRVLGATAQWIFERKENFGAFLNNATEGSSAFTEAGPIIGQTWDITGLLLNRDNPDFLYPAPNEGIIKWLDSFGMLKKSENPAQAVVLMNSMFKLETGGIF